jgi:peptide/nickel transport system substrate-binding protein
MDPQLPTTGDTGDLQALYSLYDRLTNIIPGTLTNGPGLAESWEIAKGGLEYTFYLRHAEFSNGDTITANDVKFSLERFANPAINSQYAWLNAIDTVQALNARTVRVTLQYVQAMFLDVVGHATTGIVPQRVVEKMGKEFGKNPVGSGAFIFESKTAGESISFKRNPNFWNSPKPYIDGYTLNYVPDDNARMLQVTSGIASAGYPVPYALLDQYRDVKGTRLQLEPYTNIMFIAPNLKVPPFNEQNVRLALNYATPLETINKVVFKNAAQIANSAIGKLQYWDPEIPYIPYDLDKAKAYLAKSSVPHGFTTSLLIVGTDTDSVELATILQSSWGQIGINLKIDEVDIVTLEDRFFSITNPNYDLCFFGADLWASDVGAPDEIGELMYYSKKYDFGGLFYNDPHATALVNQATHTINETVRKRDWGELQRYCLSVNPPGIPIAFGPNVSLVNSKVQGFQCLCSNFWPLEDVWINS